MLRTMASTVARRSSSATASRLSQARAASENPHSVSTQAMRERMSAELVLIDAALRVVGNDIGNKYS